MLSCMASSSQQSLRSRLFGTWAASGDEVTVLKIDKDSLYYVNEYPIVAIPYQVTNADRVKTYCAYRVLFGRYLSPYFVKID